MVVESWKIYWDEYVSNTYLYGAEINYLGRDHVEYKNKMMPPGTIIKQWYSKTNFQVQRIEPVLPIIDGESEYQLKVNIDTPTPEGCMIRLIFYDKYEMEAGTLIIRERSKKFRCPLKTYSYRMQLINGGMSEFCFHSIVIQEIADEKE